MTRGLKPWANLRLQKVWSNCQEYVGCRWVLVLGHR
jgi:hypothetical protein